MPALWRPRLGFLVCLALLDFLFCCCRIKELKISSQPKSIGGHGADLRLGRQVFPSEQAQSVEQAEMRAKHTSSLLSVLKRYQ